MSRRRIFLLGLAACLAVAAVALPGEKVLFEGKSEYNSSIKVVEDGDGLRTLVFDDNDVQQSTVKLGDPDFLSLRYTRVMPVGLAFVEGEPKRMLIVGLGGGSIPNFLHKHYPKATIEVVDIDPVVVELAKKYFGFKEDKLLRVHVGDGRKFIEDCKEPYDAIFLDAYGAEDIPYHLATVEFLREVRKALKPKGVVVSNIMSTYSNNLHHSMMRSYMDVFGEVHIIDIRNSGNVIVVALPHAPKITHDDLARRSRKLSREKKFPYALNRFVKYGHRRPGEKEKAAPVLKDKKKAGKPE